LPAPLALEKSYCDREIKRSDDAFGANKRNLKKQKKSYLNLIKYKFKRKNEAKKTN
jgi:hypothetical protein